MPGPVAPEDALLLSKQKRAQELQTLTLVTPKLAASDRVCVIDTPSVGTNRHWIIPATSAWFTCSWGVGFSLVLWIIKCSTTGAGAVKNLGVTNPPPASGINDATAALDMANRPYILTQGLDQLIVLADQAHAQGMLAAGGGENGGLELTPGQFLRFILGSTGTADIGNGTRPFAPSDAVLQASVDYIEEFTIGKC